MMRMMLGIAFRDCRKARWLCLTLPESGADDAHDALGCLPDCRNVWLVMIMMRGADFDIDGKCG